MFIVRLCVFEFVAGIVCIGMIIALLFIFVDVVCHVGYPSTC